ncbi:hypothetical protein CTI12_AA229170 [Artemisia annua]|uniref:Endonuclease/exonuclease/phosphatase domain-containing protein n=1 Tax=Artemisia annua TaxID=35608 RepID=A0A2U1NTU5_ARTAN|nr:hypothetical protein CTI12_AA229170 [Artemisia annua]
MFFNFPDEWGMGRLWMIFKKYGTVFDMFMVQRRLRNGQRYGFVRFRFVRDVEGLLRQLQKIKIGEEWLRVYVAHDRIYKGNAGPREGMEKQETRSNGATNGERYRNVGNGVNRDNRRFVDVVNGGIHRTGVNNYGKVSNGIGGQALNKEGITLNKEETGSERTIEVDDMDTNSALLGRSVVGEVKAMCFLSKLPVLCEEQGLAGIEVKLLGGLEVLVVMENESMVANVLNDKDHGLRRWMHKLRKGDSIHRTAGRITWINILGIPISGWSEGTFKKIAALHGTILGMHNCRLEGNQNLVYGRVQIHTINKGLINEVLNVTVRRKNHKVCVVEEVRDIVSMEIEEVCNGRRVDEKMEDHVEDNGMQVDDEERDEDGESNSEGGETSEDEEDNQNKVINGKEGGAAAISGDRNGGEDEESRFSGETRVGDTFDGEIGNSKGEEYGEYKRLHGKRNEDGKDKGTKENYKVDGDKSIKHINEEGDKTMEPINDVVNKDCENDGKIGISREVSDSGYGLDDYGPIMGSKKLESNGLDNKVDGDTKEHSTSGPSNNYIRRRKKGVGRKFIINENRHQVLQDGIVNEGGKNAELVIESPMCRRDKRVVSPSSSRDSGGVRMKKKRKSSGEGIFDDNEDEMAFNQGKTIGDKCVSNNKNKNGRRSIKKAMEVARKTGVQGLGENKKGVSDAYKEYYDEVGRENNGIFHFGSGIEDEAVSVRCNMNMDQVKEIGEMIGVSWLFMKMISINVRGMGESGKKSWIRSIIKDERPDVIGLQETKCGMVDDIWVEDLWGEQGCGYAQLPANGNSGGIIMIWDTRVFTCKEAVGDERFISVKGTWKGKNEEVFLVCIYGPHVSRQKTSLWDRIEGLMNKWQGAWCIFGDLNVVRRNEDRFNSQVNIKEMTEFNGFINNMRGYAVKLSALAVVSVDATLSANLCHVVDVDLRPVWQGPVFAYTAFGIPQTTRNPFP